MVGATGSAAGTLRAGGQADLPGLRGLRRWNKPSHAFVVVAGPAAGPGPLIVVILLLLAGMPG